jgi:hypothetical protein
MENNYVDALSWIHMGKISADICAENCASKIGFLNKKLILFLNVPTSAVFCTDDCADFNLEIPLYQAKYLVS